MKILVFSDAHFGDDINYDIIGGLKYVNAFGSQFPSIIKKLKSEFKKYDLVVNLGDSIFNKSKKDDPIIYKEFLRFFKDVKTPMIHLLGNHDLRFISRKQLNDFLKQEKSYYSKDSVGIHHIVLSARSHHMGFHPHLSKTQIEWLKRDLRKTKLPTVVYTHFLLDEQSIKENYYFNTFKKNMVLIEERKEVRDILEKSKKVLLVVNGHTHFYHQQIIKGIIYLNAPSITENDGKGKPTKKYMEIIIDNKKIKTKELKIK